MAAMDVKIDAEFDVCLSNQEKKKKSKYLF